MQVTVATKNHFEVKYPGFNFYWNKSSRAPKLEWQLKLTAGGRGGGGCPSLGYHTCCPVSRHWESASSWAFSLAISFKDLCEKGWIFFEHQVLGVKELSFNYAYAQVFLGRKARQSWPLRLLGLIGVTRCSSSSPIHTLLWSPPSPNSVLIGISLTARISHKAQRQLPGFECCMFLFLLLCSSSQSLQDRFLAV